MILEEPFKDSLELVTCKSRKKDVVLEYTLVEEIYIPHMIFLGIRNSSTIGVAELALS